MRIEPGVGKPAPKLELPTENNKMVSLESLRGPGGARLVSESCRLTLLSSSPGRGDQTTGRD